MIILKLFVNALPRLIEIAVVAFAACLARACKSQLEAKHLTLHKVDIGVEAAAKCVDSILERELSTYYRIRKEIP